MLFASFLGYNPMQQLLGPLLSRLSPAHAASWSAGMLPALISAPFRAGLDVAFGFAMATCVVAAIPSALTGPRTRHLPRVARFRLATVAAEGVFEPSELVVPDARKSAEPPDKLGKPD